MSQLSRLRAMAAEGDRGLPVFRPTAIPYEHPNSSQYVETVGKPQDLEALRMRAEPYGDAAVRHACWQAVMTWVLFNGTTDLLSQGYIATSSSVRLCLKEDEAHGLPDFNGLRKPPALPLMPQDVQDSIRTIAAQTIVDWHEAGSPGIVRAIEHAHGHVLACKMQYPNKDIDSVRM
ncbi:hypothetical protein C8J41_101569 [Sphingomonas sp. PP-CC-3G-468]|nr:hypothetical protein C8J39_0713 [Sphingomonas sp. PP-CC-1A-547]TCM10061.1 hypothetical protein C8J41_101569 [Sphingomonas sp. PP-CC-3G-468]